MEEVKQIYIATPVNGRREKTLAEKRQAAYERVKEMAGFLREKWPHALFVSGFTVYPHDADYVMRESYIMGSCVRLVMESDMVVMDEDWRDSRGCWVEQVTAQQYGIRIESYRRLQLMERIGA